MRRVPGTVIALLLMPPAGAVAQDLVFDIAPVEACIRAGGGAACAGRAAERCIEATPGGYTTIGMSGCTDRERAHWDGWLNTVYQQLYAKLAAQDAQSGSHAPKQAEALREMQRAWIGYRDTKCGYEASQWGGGSGTGPAMMSCLLHETARQMLYLQSSRLGD